MVKLNCLLKQLQKQNGFARVRDNILLDKALSFLKEHAEIEEVDAPEEGETEE